MLHNHRIMYTEDVQNAGMCVRQTTRYVAFIIFTNVTTQLLPVYYK